MVPLPEGSGTKAGSTEGEGLVGVGAPTTSDRRKAVVSTAEIVKCILWLKRVVKVESCEVKAKG